ncbi:glycoside hydrolase family 6 protein [Streptomyces sp. 4N509B]|uniref:glycoside hydrolase family 6 protein n=1 Tax=Streptomyces sp. 4N509B TaxID=3457413 RepID=UPI003FD11118
MRRSLRAPAARPALTVLLALAVLLGCAGSGSGGGGGAGEDPSEPAARGAGVAGGASEFWVDPDSPAARQVEAFEREGNEEDARLLRRISEQPLAHWPPGSDPTAEVAAVTGAAAAAGRTAVLVAYNIPHRDCGQYSRGGAPDGAAYRAWIDAFAAAIGEAEAVVILEPDAVSHTVDGCTAPMYVEERFQLLSYAVDRLARQPGVRTYLDAGNPSWITDPGQLVEPLRRSGVERADGLAVNVANFQTLADSSAYGHRLSELLGGAHFVVDTSRNGSGPYEGDDEPWCNPPGRALGTAPTSRTGDPLIDAYLWVKRPGESDGECRGGPAAGQWWPEYALGLARRAAGG